MTIETVVMAQSLLRERLSNGEYGLEKKSLWGTIETERC